MNTAITAMPTIAAGSAHHALNPKAEMKDSPR